MQQTVSKIVAELGFKFDAVGIRQATQAVRLFRASIQVGTEEQRKRRAEIMADTAELRKNDLQERINIRTNREATRQRQNYIRGLRNTVIGISAVTYALNRMTRATRENALSYRDFRTQTGLSTERLQQYQAMAANVAPNLSPTQVASEVSGLQQSLQNIEFGQGNIFPYQLLGISAGTKDAFKVLDALHDKIEGLDNVRAVNLIERFGLSKDWLYILRQSREEFAKLTAVMMSPDQIRRTEQLALFTNQLQFSFSNLRDQFVSFTSTGLIPFTKNWRDMATDLSSFLKSLQDSPAAFSVFASGVALITAALSPLTAMLATILLLIEDYYVWKSGGESLIGRFLGSDSDNNERAKRDLNTVKRNIGMENATDNEYFKERGLTGAFADLAQAREQGLIPEDDTNSYLAPIIGIGEMLWSMGKRGFNWIADRPLESAIGSIGTNINNGGTTINNNQNIYTNDVGAAMTGIATMTNSQVGTSGVDEINSTFNQMATVR